MSFYRYAGKARLECDHQARARQLGMTAPTCPSTFDVAGGPTRTQTVTAVRALAFQRGWTLLPLPLDLCPLHPDH